MKKIQNKRNQAEHLIYEQNIMEGFVTTNADCCVDEILKSWPYTSKELAVLLKNLFLQRNRQGES